jgi:hypothetical protein
MKHPPNRSSRLLYGVLLELIEEGKPSVKTELARFDSFVARYYPAVYNFAFELTDDPRKAVWLTYDAFLSVRKQVWRRRDEVGLVRILLKAVFRGGASEPSNFGSRHGPLKAKRRRG